MSPAHSLVSSWLINGYNERGFNTIILVGVVIINVGVANINAGVANINVGVVIIIESLVANNISLQQMAASTNSLLTLLSDFFQHKPTGDEEEIDQHCLLQFNRLRQVSVSLFLPFSPLYFFPITHNFIYSN